MRKTGGVGTYKLVGSRRNVMSRERKNLFIPVNKPSGLETSVVHHYAVMSTTM